VSFRLARFFNDAIDDGNDPTVQGDAGDDVLLGGNGNDNISGDCISHDRIDAGPGTDSCSFDPDKTVAVGCETLSLCP
jgi:hypothetical protein